MNDEVGFPRADLVQGRSLDAGMKRKYKRMQTFMLLADEAKGWKETECKKDTNKAIRFHGQLEAVDEMDITGIQSVPLVL